MKTIFKTGIALLVLALTMTSCGDDDSGSTGGGNNNLPSGSYIQAEVDGSTFKSEIMGQSTALVNKVGSGEGTLITIQGTTLDTNTLLLAIDGITETGTYTVDAEDDGTLMAYFSANNSISYDTSDCAGATGTLKITHLDDSKIEGTFEFVGKDDENCSNSKSITEGSFRGIFSN